MRYAFEKGGCLKFYSRAEDPAIVRDGDVFVYAGGVSKRIGEALRDMSEIHTYSGIELRRMMEKE
ncbi:hypothetical protein CENSYa_0605 [Cenarchaeum symbiosum A]|uniref:Uncharacterized protein n=1 Tax=Cenarchaeum symbiosum (strain A) TaxID=414004 RepID=A0RV71_CENSY|nr:hypothetical protein CENSYa_0605 [Cenarchaeum symbiosum A]